MAKIIHKFIIWADKPTTISLKERDKVVLFAKDNRNLLCFWVEKETSNSDSFFTERKFMVIGTGAEYTDEWEYVASMIDSPFVWHLIERKK